MFSPIKNFITYIQKNASGNSIFGGNSSTDESAKMETENLKTEGANTMEPKTENQDEKEEVSKKDKMETDKEDEKEIFEEQEKETSKEDVKDVKNISKEDKKETSKEDKEETLKEDKKETVKEDKKEISKEDKKVISKEDKKVVSKEDKKVIYKDDKKETSKEIKKETSQEEKKETSQEDKKEASKEDKKQTSKEDTNQTSKEDKMEASKEDNKETSKEDNKETLKEVKKETSKEDKTETSKQNKKEISKDDKIKTSKVDQKQTSEIDEQESSQEDDKLTSTEEEENKTSAKDKNESLEKKENEQNNKHAEDTKTKTITTTSTISAENSRDFEEDEVEDEDDIEAQIDTSIMLKKPVKVAATNGTEIVEVKRRNSNSGTSIVISHDYNRNMALTPIDDELQDFRHDPTAVLGTSTSTTSSNQHLDEFCSVGSAEEAKERDDTMAEDFPTEEEEDEDEDNKGKRKRKRGEDDNETETEVDEKFVDDEEEEDQFLDLENYHDNDDVIVLSDIDLNTSTASLDTVNTADDPLAIACEEEEAFAADKKAALEELNLLNTSHTSQDEDTTTTIDDDLQWLKTDLEDPQPSCSNSKALVAIKDNAAAATTTPEKEERNGEGSDSGLGSETSALHTTTTSITDTSQLNTTATATPMHTPTQLKLKDDEEMVVVSNLLQITSKSPTKDPLKPFRSNLKRRLEVDDDVVDGLGNLTSSSSASSSNLSDHSTLNGSLQKKPKRSINFDTVQVYYFPRQQGFSCVPSAGGCTLGMGARHVGFKTLTLAEHAAELRRAHRMQLQEINPRGSSSDDSEESEEDYLSEGSGSDLDGESNGFLQPVSPKQRRALLKAAGIRKIDPSEKADCRNIRNSREVCGCTCRDFCDPETCACSQSGIKCQVDRDMFPCGCSRDACGNTIGRVEFNPARVRTHFIHTLMRLEMENRQQQNPYSSAVASPSNPLQPTNPTPASYYQSHLQPQSNYSSGYASPAYNTVSDLHQQTAASSYYNPQTPSIANSLYGQQPASSLEMTHNSSATTVSSQYAIDSLDSSLFGGSTTAQPSYGELMPVASYHYANAQSQGAPYNSYHNTTIYHNATTTTLNTPPNTYSSCAVPSIPPYGTATTTEATGVYHSVNSLTNLETTTAPSCNVNNTSSLETEVSSSFISLSTPMASSSRLSQINDLLQHNRNTTTALVAVTQALGGAVLSSSSSSLATTAVSSCNGGNYNATSSSINTPPIEDAHKSCMAYEELAPPLNPAPIVGVVENINKGPDKLAQLPPLPPLTAAPRSAIMATTSETLPQTSLCKTTDKEETVTAATNEPTTIEVAAGN